jgi:hypothetical protein
VSRSGASSRVALFAAAARCSGSTPLRNGRGVEHDVSRGRGEAVVPEGADSVVRSAPQLSGRRNTVPAAWLSRPVRQRRARLLRTHHSSPFSNAEQSERRRRLGSVVLLPSNRSSNAAFSGASRPAPLL